MVDLKKLYAEEKEKMIKTLDHLRHSLSKTHIGRAVPALLDNIKVDYYGTETPLKQLCGITVPEPRMILLQPYDKNVLSNIEKAISISNLGINPQNDGKVIRLLFPMLSEEKRELTIKTIKKNGEETKTGIRNTRHHFINHIKKLEKDAEISEDEFYSGQDDFQKITNNFIEEIDEIILHKIEEIKTV